MGQLLKRKGNITNTMSNYDMFTVNADIPLSQMFGYATELRGATSGQGEFSMEYKSHQPVGVYEIQDIVDAYQKKLEEERKDK